MVGLAVPCYFGIVAQGTRLPVLLREGSSEILAGWIVRFERSPLRFRRTSRAADHAAQVASLLEALTEAATGDPAAFRPGSDATRELERSAAFLGGRFASEGATGFDVAALLVELRDVVVGMTSTQDATALTRLFEWLVVVALDGFAASGMQSLREQVNEQVESGTPLCELLPKVPALLLVGAPTENSMGNLLARAWMLAVATSAPCLIIDCSGLAEVGEHAFKCAFGAFVTQTAGSTQQLVMSGASRSLLDVTAPLTQQARLAFQNFDRLDLAVAYALERAGYLLMRQ